MNTICSVKALACSLLLSLLLVMPVWAQAGVVDKDLSFERDGMRIALTHKVCSNVTVIQYILMYGISLEKYRFYDGKLVLIEEKETHNICYTVNPDNANMIYLVDELGNQGPILLVEPKKEGV